MCIMSGCDFLKGLPGIGLKKAHMHIRKFKGFVKAIRAMRFSGCSIPREYEVGFQRAIWAFRHQRIYCPDRRALAHLNDLPNGGIGARDLEVPAALPEDLADREVRLDCNTREQFECELLHPGAVQARACEPPDTRER